MQINLLSFKPITDTISINLYSEKVQGTHPQFVYSDECPELWKQHADKLSECKRLFCSFNNEEAECKGEKYTATMNLNNAPRFALNYFRHLLYNHFRGKVAAVGIDYVDNVEVWVKDTEQPDNKTTQFLRFSLIPQSKNISEGFELLVSFNGYSVAYNRPISELDIEETHYRVIANGEVVKYKNITPEHKSNITQIYPVINRALAAQFGLKEYRTRTLNKYTSTYDKITAFCQQYLFTTDFNILNINPTNFLTIPNEKILRVADNSNVLLFGNNKTDLVPYNGMKEYGPYLPSKRNNVRFFFIAQKQDVKVCSKLYDIFCNGLDKFVNNTTGEISYKFKPFSDFIKQPFNTDQNSSIFFDNLDTAIQEITTKLQEKKLEKDCFYIALYISPINKDNTSSPHHDIYFKLKELLLDKGITSQAIYREKPDTSGFNFHLPNIATAILAKIGGIPWQLQPSKNKNDLIVGVGAFKSEKIGERYIGSAFCFNKDGIFQNFDCYRDNDLDHLVADIRKALMHYVVEHDKAERLIIHYYKTMSKRESKPIVDMLFRLGLTIPVIIVTINKTEESEIVVFDNNVPDKMPISGTIIPIKTNEFLLYNNSKYKQGDKCDYLFPVKVKIAKLISNGEKGEITKPEVTEMINLVYQLSRMYWKSVKQQNLPITIKYPEMVAEIVPHFSDAELPAFGKTNLWFL